MQVLSTAQVNALLDGTKDDAHHALSAVLLLGGLRPSEALALRWGDVHLDRAELRVVRKLRRPGNGATWLVGNARPSGAAASCRSSRRRSRRCTRTATGGRSSASSRRTATPRTISCSRMRGGSRGGRTA
jgi:integrase